MSCNRVLYSLAISAALLAPTTAHAGAANAELSCTGKKKTDSFSLKGEIPGDFSEFALTMKMGKASDNYDDTKQMIVVFNDFRSKVFAFAVMSNKGEEVIKLYATPKTIKVKSGSHGEMDVRFQGTLSGRRPGVIQVNSAKDYIHNLKVKCTYHYSI